MGWAGLGWLPEKLPVGTSPVCHLPGLAGLSPQKANFPPAAGVRALPALSVLERPHKCAAGHTGRLLPPYIVLDTKWSNWDRSASLVGRGRTLNITCSWLHFLP